MSNIKEKEFFFYEVLTTYWFLKVIYCGANWLETQKEKEFFLGNFDDLLIFFLLFPSRFVLIGNKLDYIVLP